jgi:hypothetical protein
MSEKESLEKLNFLNLIKFYEDELRAILDGNSVHDVFNQNERSKLRDKNILNYSLDCWYISDEVKDVLEKNQK